MVDLSLLRAALAEYLEVQNVTKFFDFEDMDVDAVHQLAAAARLFLAEREGGQKVWWCVVHDSKAATPPIKAGPLMLGMCQHYSLTPSEGQGTCRMVKAWLTIEEEPPKDPWDYDP